MESFSIGINDEETKEKGDILDDEVPPCFEMEDAPKMPCYKTKIFIILVSIISIIVIGIVSYVLMFIIFSKEKESKCDIENGYYIPDDKAKEKKCLKCDLNCKTCHGNLTHSQCEKCFSSFIPFYEYGKLNFEIKDVKMAKNMLARNVIEIRMNVLLVILVILCLKMKKEKSIAKNVLLIIVMNAVVKKIQVNANPVLVHILLYIKNMKLLNVYVKKEKKKNV